MDHFINGVWIKGTGVLFSSINPATHEKVFEVRAATQSETNHAITAAQVAFAGWSNLSLDERIDGLERFRNHIQSSAPILAEAISKETGKPLWDAHNEIQAMSNKIPLSIEAYHQRCKVIQRPQPHGVSITRYKPHGVVVVIGPFNFPGHLPNGHIVPALLAGNTVVFKPSEYTPLTAAIMIQCWKKAGLPDGVINLVQGLHETGKALLTNPSIAGVFFTGSAQTGNLILKQLGSSPEKILALEMGGNNPLIISHLSDIKAASHLTIQSAYLTSGQRCTCARRLILIENQQTELFLNELIQKVRSISVGSYTERPEPFMGPLIHQTAVEHILNMQNKLKSLGGVALVEARILKPGTSFLSPGLMDVTHVQNKPDEELFGPFLQIVRVRDLNTAIEEANRTQYGLSAGLFSDRREEYEFFYQKIKAGIINWNTALTGASSAAPFGGIGQSGNHRPSAFYAADYCSYPVASLESEFLNEPMRNNAK